MTQGFPGLEHVMNNHYPDVMKDTMWKSGLKGDGWTSGGFRDDPTYHFTFNDNRFDHMKNQLTGERFFTNPSFGQNRFISL